MNANEIAIATINEAKSVPNEPITPTTENANCIVVIFDGEKFSINDNGEGVGELDEASAIRVLAENIQQNMDLFI